MSSLIADRIESISDGLAAVRDHCMCRRFTETPTHYLVLFPDGFAFDGIHASKGGGKRIALDRLLTIMEREWKRDML